MFKTNRGFGFIAVIVIIAIIALGGGAYYSSKKAHMSANANATTSAAVTTGTSTNAVASASSSASAEIKVGPFANGSIRSLLSAGKDLECSVSYSTTTSKGVIKTEGSAFISGDNMRGDFKMTGDAATATDAHMIRQGDTVIAWSGKSGAKISLSAIGTLSASSTSNVSLDQNVSYRCINWTKDESKFKAPTDVKIYDVKSVMTDIGASIKAKLR